MPLINVVFVLIVVGVGLWLINRSVPMTSKAKAQPGNHDGDIENLLEGNELHP